MPQKLVPLRIPPGWGVVANDFVEWSIDDSADRAEAESFLSEDLLRIVQLTPAGGVWTTTDGGNTIDLGWMGADEPGGLLDGEYLLTVMRGDWHDEDYVELRHRDWRIMREAVELALRTVRAGRPPKLLTEDFIRMAELP